MARRAVLLLLAQAHALRLARPPALKPKRLAKAATLATAALTSKAHKALASGVEAAAGAAAAEALAGETAAELAETALTAAVGPSKFVVVLRFAFSAFLLSFVLGRVRAVLAARAERRRSSFNSFAAMGAQEAPPSKADSTVIDVPSTPVPAPAPPKPAPPPPKPGTVEPPPKKKKRVLDIFRKKATRPVRSRRLVHAIDAHRFEAVRTDLTEMLRAGGIGGDAHGAARRRFRSSSQGDARLLRGCCWFIDCLRARGGFVFS